MTYVLKSRPYLSFDNFGDGYYTGASYIFQGECYAVCERELEKAKQYKSLKVARNSATRYLSKFCNYIFDVVGIENGKEVYKESVIKEF